MSDSQINISPAVKGAVQKLSESDKKSAVMGMRSFYEASAKHLTAKLPFSNMILKHVRCHYCTHDVRCPSRKKKEAAKKQLEGARNLRGSLSKKKDKLIEDSLMLKQSTSKSTKKKHTCSTKVSESDDVMPKTKKRKK